jgi:hypothetical protein
MTDKQPERVYLSRRNLITLLSKLDRNLLEPGSSACTLIKSDNIHPVYPQTMEHIMVTAVEDRDYYNERMAGLVHPFDDPNHH